jgi:hypothetical protein
VFTVATPVAWIRVPVLELSVLADVIGMIRSAFAAAKFPALA